MSKGDAQFLGAALTVDDLEKSVTFYKAVCGLNEIGRVALRTTTCFGWSGMPARPNAPAG